MTAIEIAEPGGPEVLRACERPLPRPGPGEVLIKVAAAGVNRPDALQRRGLYPPPAGASDIPGLEVAGTVVAHGAGVRTPALGSAVCALLAGGGYAAFAAAPVEQVLPAPAGLDLAEAAALPETVFTVWTNVFERAHLRAGETILVHGGSSGIGTTAIQMCRALGARVLVSVRDQAKADACLSLGAMRAIRYPEEDFVAAVREATDGRGVDVILDMVGGDYFPRNLACLAVDGRLVQIAFQRGRRSEIDLQAVMTRRLTITGSTLRARAKETKGAIAESVRASVWPLIEAGALRPVIDSRYPLRDAAKAHARMEAGVHIGKIVLIV